MWLSALIGKNLGLHLVYTPDKVLGENLLGPAAAHDFPAFDRIETVAVHGGNIQVVDGRDHGPVQGFDNVHQFQLVLDIQMIGGLVQDQTGGLLGQGAGPE